MQDILFTDRREGLEDGLESLDIAHFTHKNVTACTPKTWVRNRDWLPVEPPVEQKVW